MLRLKNTIMDKKEILNKVKAILRTRDVISSWIKFPERLGLSSDNDVITVKIDKVSVTKNMQDDSSTFEGWILCIKTAFDAEGVNYKFVLDWDGPEIIKDTDKQHYQRFLYRAYKFDEIFGGSNSWFKIKNKKELSGLKVKYNKNEVYCLNMPSTVNDERVNNSTANPENVLENYIVKNQTSLLGLKTICNNAILERQLPVGLFKGKVSEVTAIFPSKKSAIDIWGITGTGEDLYILELKAKNNKKVGCISELFCYTMIVHEEQNGVFVRDSEEGRRVQKTSNVKAYILAPEIHPLITREVFMLMNEAFKTKKKRIVFGYIEFNKDLSTFTEKFL